MEPQAAPLMPEHCRKSLLQEKLCIQVIFPHARYANKLFIHSSEEGYQMMHHLDSCWVCK